MFRFVLRSLFCRMLCCILLAGSSCSATVVDNQTVAEPLRIDIKTLDSYVGQYRFQREPDIVLSVTREGQSLFVATRRDLSVPLEAISERHFRDPVSKDEYVFATSADSRLQC